MNVSFFRFLSCFIILLSSKSAFSENIEKADFVLDSLVSVVNNSVRTGERFEFRDHARKLINFAEESSSPRKDCYIGFGYSKFGHSFYGSEFEFGLQYFDTAETYYIKCDETKAFINFKNDIATYYAIAGELDTAASLWMDSYHISIEHNNYSSWFSINNNLARCYLVANKIDLFNCHIELAKDHALIRNDSNAVASSFRLMGSFYKERDLKKAEYYYNASIDWCTRSNSPRYRWAILELADFFKEIGELNKSISFYEDFVDLTDSEDEEITKASIENIKKEYAIKEAKNKLEKLELQHQLTLEKGSNQKKWNWLISISSILMLIGLVFYYRNFRIQKELGVDLNKKNNLLKQSENKASELAKVTSQFSDTISHELRTPLHGIIGLTTILISEEKQKLSKDGQGFLENLKFSADYLLNLINDVLEVSKLSSNKVELEKSDFNLQFFIANLSSTFKYLVNKNHNRFKIEIDESIPVNLNGDPIRLSQVIINLVGNALKFTQDGEVVLKVKMLSKNEESVKIFFEIKDTGSGIPLDKQKDIFDKYIQIKENTFGYAGTGLGLPIVKDLLKLFNSEIHLESKVGEGSTFWFEIDFEFSNSGLLMSGSSDENHERSKFELEKCRILIVDDNDINLIVSERVLEQKGYQVVTCNNGFSAIQILESENFDLILMDLHMPKMDGVETIQEIRKGNLEIPIVLLTASNVADNWPYYKDNGFNDYIVKPYDKNAFLRKVLKNIQNQNKTC